MYTYITTCISVNVWFFLDVPKFYDTVIMNPVVKNGSTHLEVDSLSWKFTATKLYIKMDNLFNGDKVLGKLYSI
jgi:hypothetical protein